MTEAQEQRVLALQAEHRAAEVDVQNLWENEYEWYTTEAKGMVTAELRFALEAMGVELPTGANRHHLIETYAQKRADLCVAKAKRRAKLIWDELQAAS